MSSLYSPESALSWGPPDSTITTNADGSITITPPAGWNYAGYDNNGNLFEADAASATVSCTCTGSGSCSPFTAHKLFDGSTSGCAGNCTSCLMSQSIADYTNIQAGGYFNPTIQAQIMLQGSGPLPGTFDGFFDNTSIQQVIQAFVAQIYPTGGVPTVTIASGVATLPSGYSFALVNICGRGLTMPIPNNQLPQTALAGAAASCSCTKGSCSVHSANIGLGSATWCEGNCSGTCTLTTSVSQGGQTAYTTDNYQF